MPRRKPLLGMALGGGGVRGFAHLGVLKVFKSEGIQIDCISGTSMGGIIAAMTACGMDVGQIEEVARKITNFSEMAKLMDMKLSNLDHIFSSEKVQAFFKDILGEGKQFSDTKVPLAISAVDFEKAEEVVLTNGDLIPAINATMGLPGVIEEAVIEGRTLVDGGSLNNVPADYVRTMGAEVVIAVDVSPIITDIEYWEQQKMPGIATRYWRSNAIMGANITSAKLRKAEVDFLLQPEIGKDVATLGGFDQIGQVIAAGAQAAWEILPELKVKIAERFFFSKGKITKAKILKL